MAVETQTQITREAPEIEAYRLGLLESAKNLADQRITVPKQMVAGMSGLQDAAIAAASPKTGGIINMRCLMRLIDLSTHKPRKRGCEQHKQALLEAVEQASNKQK